VTPSTGNVFAVTARRLTQSAVAKVLRISQPRVSDLLRGQLHLFSTDMLIDFLVRLGIRVRFVATPARRRRASADRCQTSSIRNDAVRQRGQSRTR
jgi:transcriptional regulator with XRE-family HTH domain